MDRSIYEAMSDEQRAMSGNLQFALPSPRPSPQPPIPNPSRKGFTLVELLMVITIIGMLVALVSVAAVRAIGTARNAQITTEIGLLDAAMQTYKNDTAGAYPPDCSLLSTPASGTPTATDVQNRQNRILAHLRKAFPRLIVAGGYGSSSSPAAGTLQYMSINAFSQSTLYGSLFSGTTPNGTSQWGDFDNMDPAEAMVFWLGGFPIPFQDTNGKWSYKLIGFSSNKVGNASSSSPGAFGGPNAGFGPFNLDVQSRDAGPFEFAQARLGDADGDGWPEYYPPVGNVAQPPTSKYPVSNPMPPYVYFDAVSYGYYTTGTNVYPLSAIYPSPSATVSSSVVSGSPGAQPLGQATAWGYAVPYVQTVPSSGSMTWVNPSGFQIICAGLDQYYWLDFTGKLTNNLLRVYPSGINQATGVNTYSQGDLDNLTNFTSGTLQSTLP
jgi:prepilin-type N-terminal cleavage/methylation domain-containing protein